MSPDYDALVTRLARYAHLHPRMYRARVAGLAVLGYVYLFAAVLLLATLVAGAMWMTLRNVGAGAFLRTGVPIGVFTWMTGRALWVRIDPPEGLEITRAEAPCWPTSSATCRARTAALARGSPACAGRGCG